MKEPVAKYLARPRYKRTDIGMIPEGWDVKRLGDVASVSAGGTPSRSIAEYWNGDIPWITTAEVNVRAIDHAEQCITKEGLKNSAAKLLPPGTLLMALYGQGKTRGKVGVLGIEAATNQACAAISFDSRISNIYAFHYLSSQYEAIRKLSNTGNQENLNGALVRSIPLPLPPKIEQEAIARALNDTDALIESLEQLLAKKRQVKQGAMQELLTGKKRLPGFGGEWEQKVLGAIAAATKGSQLQSSDINEQGSFAHFNGGMTPSGYTDKTNAPGESIAISEGGNSCGYVQYLFEPYWCGGHCYSVIPKDVDNRFLYHALKGEERSIMALRVGSGLPNVQKTALLAFVIRCPVDLEEQTTIAANLSDMDADIAAIDAKLAKARQIKQGMMQELLTGRIRLV